MKNTIFSITSEDVKKLNKNVGYCLTDNNEPLDLFCRAFNLWTENDCIENNRYYIAEQEDFFVKEYLNLENAFLATLTKEERELLAENLIEYNKQLKEFTEKAKEYFIENNKREDKKTQTEFEKYMYQNDLYLHKEYLYGDNSNPGILKLIQEKLNGIRDNIDFDYNEETGDIELSIQQDEDEETKQSILDMLKYKAIHYIEKAKQEREKRAEENKKIREYQEQRRLAEIEEKKQKILSFEI